MKHALNVLAAAAVSAACATSAVAADTVRYATDGFGLGGLIVLAAEKGYFEDEGIDAVLQTYAYGVDTVDAVLAGQADFGVIIDMPSMPRLKTGKLTAVSVIGVPKPGFHKLYVANDIDAPAGLQGKSIAIATGTSQEFVTRSYLTAAGLDPEADVELTGFSDLFSIVGAMKAGRLDAAWLWSDGVPTIEADGDYKFITDDSVVEQGTTTLLLTAASFNEEHPELVVKTIKALARGVADIEADLQGSAEIIAKRVGADPAKVASRTDDNRFKMSFDSQAMDSFIAKYDFLVDAGKIEPFDILETFDSSALAEALPSAEIASPLAK